MTVFHVKLMAWVPLLPISGFFVFFGLGSIYEGGVAEGVMLLILGAIMTLYNYSYQIAVDQNRISSRRFWLSWRGISISGSRLEAAKVGPIGNMRGYLVNDRTSSLELIAQLISREDEAELLRLFKERGGVIAG